MKVKDFIKPFKINIWGMTNCYYWTATMVLDRKYITIQPTNKSGYNCDLTFRTKLGCQRNAIAFMKMNNFKYEFND